MKYIAKKRLKVFKCSCYIVEVVDNRS